MGLLNIYIIVGVLVAIYIAATEYKSQIKTRRQRGTLQWEDVVLVGVVAVSSGISWPMALFGEYLVKRADKKSGVL